MVLALNRDQTPAKLDALRELAREWRQRRQVDTDATHAVRVGCAEQLEEVIDRLVVSHSA